MHAIGIGVGIGIGEDPRSLAPYLGQVATRSYLNRAGQFNAGLSGICTRQAHWLRDSVTSIRFVYSNWMLDPTSGEEVGSGGALQIRAAIEAAGGTRTQITFGGNAQGSVADGGDLVSDAIAWSGTEGDKFYSRTQQLNASGCYYMDKASSAIGDRLDFDPTDHTMSGTIADGIAGYTYGPSAIIATTRKRSVLLLGTSRTHGVGDTPDSSGDMGLLAHSIGPTNAYCNGGSPGHKGSDFALHHAQSLAFAQYFSDVAIEFGQNDAGPDNVREADLTTIYGAFASSSRRVWGVTLDPYTEGTFVAADGSDQTAKANWGPLNGWINGNPTPAYGHFDVAPPVELPTALTKWKPNYTGDGVHANATGEAARMEAIAATVQAALAH